MRRGPSRRANRGEGLVEIESIVECRLVEQVLRKVFVELLHKRGSDLRAEFRRGGRPLGHPSAEIIETPAVRLEPDRKTLRLHGETIEPGKNPQGSPSPCTDPQ